MSRVTRLFIAIATTVAVAAHLAAAAAANAFNAWLGAGAWAATAIAATLAPVWTGRVLLALAFVAPGVLSRAFGLGTVPDTLWLVAAAAWVVASGRFRAWSIPQPWRAVAVTWGFVVALCWPVVYLRELDFEPSLLFSSMSNGISRVPISGWAAGVTTAALSFLVGLLWFDRLFAQYGEPPAADRLPDADTTTGLERLQYDVILPLAVSFAVCVFVSLYQSWVDPAFLSFGVWIELRRATGTLFDGNALGMVAATWGVVLAGLWAAATGRTTGEGFRWRSLLPLALGCLGVFASGSRTAFVAYLAGVVSLGLGLQRARARLWKVAAALVVALALLAGAASLGVLRTATPLQRLAATLPSPTPAGVAAFARSMWVRDGWGLASVEAIKSHPLIGVGLGTFARQSVDYYYRATGRILPPDNAQNWWRQQASEFGAAGAIFALAWTLLLLRLLLRRPAAGGYAVAGAGVAGALAGLGIASLFGVPTQAPCVAFSAWLFAFLAVRLFGQPAASREQHRSPLRRTVAVAVAALLVAAVVAGQIYGANADLRPPIRAMQSGAQYGHGFWRGGVMDDGQPFWWTGREASFVFPTGAGVQEFTATPMHPDIARNPVRVEIFLNGHRLVDRVTSEPSPIALRLRAQPGERALFIETRVSRTFGSPADGPKGLRIQRRYDPSPKE